MYGSFNNGCFHVVCHQLIVTAILFYFLCLMSCVPFVRTANLVFIITMQIGAFQYSAWTRPMRLIVIEFFMFLITNVWRLDYYIFGISFDLIDLIKYWLFEFRINPSILEFRRCLKVFIGCFMFLVYSIGYNRILFASSIIASM